MQRRLKINMNIPVILNILERQDPTNSFLAFYAGAAATDCIVISGNAEQASELLTGKMVIPIDKVVGLKNYNGEQVLFDPAAVLALLQYCINSTTSTKEMSQKSEERPAAVEYEILKPYIEPTLTGGGLFPVGTVSTEAPAEIPRETSGEVMDITEAILPEEKLPFDKGVFKRKFQRNEALADG